MDKFVYSARGSWNESMHKYDINYSGILSFLMKEAAKCDSYSSDLFIDWFIINENLKDQNYTGETYLFGFRDMGVDHETFIKHRGHESYRKIYKLKVTVVQGEVTMELFEVVDIIPRPRLEEIATKFKDALFEACGSEAWDYINDTDIDPTPEEMEWLGIELPGGDYDE